MLIVSGQQLENLLDFPSLINALGKGFQSSVTVPQRQHYDLPNPAAGMDSTLLLMPAWDDGKYIGVKIITVSPLNTKEERPTVQGIYLLFDLPFGAPLAQMDARMLTNRRTAAASALASQYLSNPDSQTLLMIGTGALSPHLIQAHASVRPIQIAYIWGRDLEKAKNVAYLLKDADFVVEPIDDLDEYLEEADIISCATLSERPLIHGNRLRSGQHLDLVGSFKPQMREADDETIRRASLFVDTREVAPKESGDIAVPLQKGIISMNSIQADLFGLCRGKHPGRKNPQEITLFKSVGHALEDLVAARLAFSRITG